MLRLISESNDLAQYRDVLIVDMNRDRLIVTLMSIAEGRIEVKATNGHTHLG